jgi:TonB family protein
MLLIINKIIIKVMKNKIQIYSVLLMAFLGTLSINLCAQCDLELQEQIKNDIEKDGITFLKSFSIELGSLEDVSSFSMVLKEKTWYRLYFYESEKYKAKGHFEMRHDTMLIGGSRPVSTGKKNQYFDIKCNKAQAYNLSVIKDVGDKYCAEVVLAQVKKLSDLEAASSGLGQNPINEVYTIADVMPEFVEGKNSIVVFREWIAQQMVYPEEAMKQNIEGKVYVQFVVSNEGYVKDVTVVRGVNPILDNYAVSLISKSPKWAKPGYVDGKAVNIAFTFPMVFHLE